MAVCMRNPVIEFVINSLPAKNQAGAGMFIIRTIKWLLISLVFLIVGAVLYLSFADLNWLKPRIEIAVADVTGRKLKLNGNFDINIVPSPSISLADASFANADWGSDPMMARVGSLSAEVGLWSLLSGPIRVHYLRLKDVDILLEKNGEEQGNWELGKSDSEEQESAAEPDSGSLGSDGLPVFVEFAQIRNIKVTYKEPGAEPTSAALASLDIKSDDATYMDISASGEVTDQPLKLVARLGPERALEQGHGIEVNLEPTYGDYSIKANGTLGVLADALLLHSWEVQYKDTETQLDGRVALSPDGNTHFTINSAGPSLASLELTLPEIAFTAALVAKIVPEQIVLDAIDTSFGKSDLSGSLQVGLGEKMDVKGELTSKLLDLTPFTSDEEGVGTEEGASKAVEEVAGKQKKNRYVFVEEPLELEVLNSMDVDLQATINKLRSRDGHLRDVVTRVVLKDGDLHLTNRFSGEGEGRSVNDIKFTTSGGETAQLDMLVKVRDFRVNLLSGEDAGRDTLPPLDITADLQATGKSPRALAASSNGRVLVTLGKGKVESGVAGRISGDIIGQLFSALNPFSKEDKYNVLECMVLGLELNSGKADITGMLFETEKIKAMGEGGIDLNDETLAIEFETQPRSGFGISADMFVTPFIKLSGTLASPALGVNKQGVLLKGTAAVATLGLSLLAEGAAGRAAGTKDRCEAMLDEIGGHPSIDT